MVHSDVITGNVSARSRAHIQDLELPSTFVRVRSGKPGEIVDREKARECAAKHTHPRIYRGSGNGACVNLLVSGQARSIIECEDPENRTRRGSPYKKRCNRSAHITGE